MRSLLLAAVAALPLTVLPLAAAPARADDAAVAIAWADWSPQVFARAKAEGKLVLLDLGTKWCHWCGVMEQTTYADPRVRAAMAEHFVAVHVDADAHPDLSQRYENWGWPATIVFDAEGHELWKGRGYIEPDTFAFQLAALADDPTPEAAPQRVRAAGLDGVDPRFIGQMDRRFAFAWDYEKGGWGSGHKFIQAEALEYALSLVPGGDALAARMARLTLTNARALVDPVDGGIYQYSEANVWDRPHYEKIGISQAAALRVYAQAATALDEPAFLDAARDIARFLTGPMSAPGGGFHANRDADAPTMPGKDYYALDAAARAKVAAPAIDQAVYARENGQIIQGFVALFEATGDRAALDRALQAAEAVRRDLERADGGFDHGGDGATTCPCLPDTLAMAQAELDLYRATADAVWLARASAAADMMLKTFLLDEGGLASAARVPGDAAGSSLLAQPFRHLDDNTAAVRFLNLLARYTGKAEHQQGARRVMAFLAATPEARTGSFWPGLLLAHAELAREPLHLVVVGPKADARAARLYAAALAVPGTYRRVEWWDPAAGPLPHHDVEFPELPDPQAFSCTQNLCSIPMDDPARIGPQALLAQYPPD
ncbi:DUF255 domain-containing protein [Zavarzinia sp. CC-PAN008]|uniref:DUF255 domain-containing protein n=1 Tax=Zavarzinia sp. CC-PAN008 TaxID=3243332 RepID=UPI003F745C1A